MKTIDLGQSAAILANNDTLAAQARLGQLAATSAGVALRINNPDLAHINFKATSGEALTPEERDRHFDYALYTMMHWRWEYEAYRAGDLPYLDVPAWRAQARSSPIWRETWDRSMGTRDTEFARFVDENVLSD